MIEQRRQRVSDIPLKEEMYNTLLSVIRALGGSGTNAEIEAHVIDELGLPDDVLEDRAPGGGSRLRTRLGLAKSELKISGFIDNPTRAVWSLTRRGSETETLNPRQVTSEVASYYAARHQAPESSESPQNQSGEEDDIAKDSEWRNQLRNLLLSMPPGDFERLCKTMLEGSGFTDVRVTGRTGDDGIDGYGIFRIEGLIAMPVAFQCKRYSGSVGPNLVRELRGSLGRQAERGLLITTGTFTRGAIEESVREGGVPIDLMDGDALMDKLAELELGVREVTRTEVDVAWWESSYGVSLSDTLAEDTE